MMIMVKQFAIASHSSLNSELLAALIAFVAIGFIVYRQLKARPVTIGLLVILPLVLLLIGIRSISQLHFTAATITQLIASLIIGFTFGYIACLKLDVHTDSVSGGAVVKGSWSYFGWFIGAMIARLIIAGIVHLGFHTQVFSSSSWVILMLSVAAFIATRSVYLYFKVKSLGLPLVGKHRL